MEVLPSPGTPSLDIDLAFTDAKLSFSWFILCNLTISLTTSVAEQATMLQFLTLE